MTNQILYKRNSDHRRKVLLSCGHKMRERIQIQVIVQLIQFIKGVNFAERRLCGIKTYALQKVAINFRKVQQQFLRKHNQTITEYRYETNYAQKNLLTTLVWTFLDGTWAIKSMAHFVFVCFFRPVTAKRTFLHLKQVTLKI